MAPVIPPKELQVASLCDVRWTHTMQSRVAQEAEWTLIESTQRLSPGARLNAFLAHRRLMMDLYQAGQAQIRSTQLPP
jgi:hypothetical protein